MIFVIAVANGLPVFCVLVADLALLQFLYVVAAIHIYFQGRRMVEIAFVEVEFGIFLAFLHEQSIDRQCHGGSLTEGGAAEVYAAEFSADPYGCCEFWVYADEPTVGVVVGCSRLAGYGAA